MYLKSKITFELSVLLLLVNWCFTYNKLKQSRIRSRKLIDR